MPLVLLPTPTSVQRDHPERVRKLKESGAKTMMSRKAGKNRPNSILDAVMFYGLLPTPNAMEGSKYTTKINLDSQNGRGLTALAKNSLLPTPEASNYKTGHRNKTSRIDRKIKQGWTIELNDLATLGMLPTPTSSMVTTADFVQAKFHSSKRPEYSKCQDGTTSQLNPLYVAEMMGFPPDWTVLPFLRGEQNPSKDSEMQ